MVVSGGHLLPLVPEPVAHSATLEELGVGDGEGAGTAGVGVGLGLGMGLGLGLELFSTQLAVSVTAPLTHLVVPLTTYPELHVGVHLLPE